MCVFDGAHISEAAYVEALSFVAGGGSPANVGLHCINVRSLRHGLHAGVIQPSVVEHYDLEVG
jgi:hypothetical protein